MEIVKSVNILELRNIKANCRLFLRCFLFFVFITATSSGCVVIYNFVQQYSVRTKELLEKTKIAVTWRNNAVIDLSFTA